MSGVPAPGAGLPSRRCTKRGDAFDGRDGTTIGGSSAVGVFISALGWPRDGAGSSAAAIDTRLLSMTMWRVDMLTLSLICSSLIQAGWQVQEAPLVPSGWVADEVVPVDDETVGVIASPSADAGAPLMGVFLASGGTTPRALATFAEAVEATRSGTGFTVAVPGADAGVELLRVRRDGSGAALVSLGTFPRGRDHLNGEISAVSCDSSVSECAVVMVDGSVVRCNRGVRSTFTITGCRPSPTSNLSPTSKLSSPCTSGNSRVSRSHGERR